MFQKRPVSIVSAFGKKVNALTGMNPSGQIFSRTRATCFSWHFRVTTGHYALCYRHITAAPPTEHGFHRRQQCVLREGTEGMYPLHPCLYLNILFNAFYVSKLDSICITSCRRFAALYHFYAVGSTCKNPHWTLSLVRLHSEDFHISKLNPSSLHKSPARAGVAHKDQNPCSYAA